MFSKVNDKIYKCNLATISKDSVVYKNLTTKENILNAKKKIIKEILIQKTLSKKYVKELVTGKVFPVYRYSDNYYLGTHLDQEVPSYMVFAYIKENNHYGNITTYLFEASDLEVIDYLEKHPDKKAYTKELDDLCRRQEHLYLEAKSLNLVSPRGKIKQKINK